MTGDRNGPREVRTHKDLEVWKEAIKLAKEVYGLTTRFPREEIYGLSAQLRRSALSVPSNIAEGAARNSTKEFVQFLYIALGSLAELETQLILAKELAFPSEEKLEQKASSLRKMLVALIDKLKRR